jgi:aspartate kinase
MSTIPVMKFGGTTLEGEFAIDPERYTELLQACDWGDSVEDKCKAGSRCRNRMRAMRLLEVATDFVIPHLTQGRTPVVITSAFGWATDKWDELARGLSDQPDDREYARLQMTGELRSNSGLALALRARGYAAMSLTGREAGIVTTRQYRNAGIEAVDSTYVSHLVSEGIVPVVAGFQGYFHDERTGRDEVAILGRGGSNLTAVALAHALSQRECCMYSDVDGVYDKDPRECADARKFETIYAEDLWELDTWPGVIQEEAVRYAMKFGIDIWIKHGRQPEVPGTLILCRRKECVFV